MFPKSSKDIKYLNVTKEKPIYAKTESTLNNLNEERDSPDAIINFINKKIVFKSKFDKKGSEQFLSSKDIALCDVILDDEIEDDENESYNNISFMKEFTFDKEKNLVNIEKNDCIQNSKCCHLRHSLFKPNKLNNNYCYSKKNEKDKDKNSGKYFK